jgi:endonuclease YncB( thermonuclease family)
MEGPVSVSRETSHSAVMPAYIYAYHAEVLRWVDGDTVDMRAWQTLDFGFGQKFTPEYTGRFRLTIVDTPERGEPGWAEATDYCKQILPVGTVTQIRTYRDPDNFGRYLADITIPGMGTTSISSLLLQNGLATVWS